MKMKKMLSLFFTLILLLGILTGCGATSKSTDTVEQAAMEAEANDAPMSANGTLTSSSSDASAAAPEDRKWIITVNMTAETEDLDALLEALDEKIASLDGYVEDQRIYNGSSYSSRRYRSAYLTIRIPAQDVEHFTEEVSGLSNVVSSEQNREDVTLSYVATESRVNALTAEEARLLELMAKAETMADLLEIEARLTDVRYELEKVTSQLRTYDNQINYATIYLDIEEVQEYTPVEDPTLWERISSGFTASLKGLGESLQNILVWLVVSSPYILVYGGIVLVIVLLILRRKRKAPREKKQPWQTPPPPEEEQK